jgi:hypothetical protein
VVKESPDKFGRHYGSKTNLFYGTLQPRFLKTQPVKIIRPSVIRRSK